MLGFALNNSLTCTASLHLPKPSFKSSCTKITEYSSLIIKKSHSNLSNDKLWHKSKQNINIPPISVQTSASQIKIISLQMVMVHNVPSPPLSATTSCPVIPKSILIKQCWYDKSICISNYRLKPSLLKRRKLTHNNTVDTGLYGFKTFRA